MITTKQIAFGMYEPADSALVVSYDPIRDEEFPYGIETDEQEYLFSREDFLIFLRQCETLLNTPEPTHGEDDDSGEGESGAGSTLVATKLDGEDSSQDFD